MTIAQQLGRLSGDIENRAGRGEFFKICHLLLKHGSAFEAQRHAESERAVPRVQSILKSVVTGGTLGDWGSISDYVNIQSSFQESLRDASVFDAVLDGGMVRAPLRSRGFSIITGINGSVLPEKSVKPISSLVLAAQLLEPKKASAIVVISKEMAFFPGSQQLFGNELQRAIVAATDTNFLAALIAATTPTASAGSTLANIVTDLGVLLSAITTSATSRIYFITSATNMKKLVLKANTIGAPAFASLGPSGGEILPGITAIASDSVPADTAIMFASDALVGNADLILPGRSDQSTLQMETAPDSPPTASTVPLSLWQSDLLALRVERFFGFTIMRASGVASLSGVTY